MIESIKHILEQPFVAATGLAALVHGTWSLGTLFAGQQPPAGFTPEFAGWLVPALLIAFALDIGQIATSAEIRRYGLSRSRGATFLIFAVATYYLQWLYIAHHMPALELAPGVRQTWEESATVLRDAAVWIVPLLLPLSTLLYTFSTRKNDEHTEATIIRKIEVVPLSTVEQPHTDDQDVLPESVGTPGKTIAKCDSCGWEKEYDSPGQAAQALRGHKRHCPANHPQSVEVYSNGNGVHK